MRTFLEVDDKTFGDVLKIYRKTNKMTQKKVAEYLGVDRSTYAKYETMRKPEIDVVLKLSVLYRVSLDDFMSSFFVETSEPSAVVAVSAPEGEETLLEVTPSEKRLIMLFRNSVRKAEIIKKAEEIYYKDNELIKEVKGC